MIFRLDTGINGTFYFIPHFLSMPSSRDMFIFLFGITFVDPDLCSWLQINLVYTELSPETGKALSFLSCTETKGPITSSLAYYWQGVNPGGCGNIFYLVFDFLKIPAVDIKRKSAIIQEQ